VGAVLQPAGVAGLVESGVLTVEGDDAVLEQYAAVLDEFDKEFPIGTPDRVGSAAPAVGSSGEENVGEESLLRAGVDVGVRVSAAASRATGSVGQATLRRTRVAAGRIAGGR
jgi:hypothetical protein